MGDEQVPVSPPPAASFGEEMRKEREIRGISLKEIADATKISKRYLEAIEKDDYNTLPAPVFTRGFVREYARYLGLNPDEAVNRYLHYRQELEQTGQAPREPRREPPRDIAHEPLREMRHETARESLRKIQTAPETPAERPRRAISPAIFVFLLIVAAFVGMVWLIQNRTILRRDKPADQTSTSNETVARVLAPTATTAPPAPPVDPDLVMRIHATENAWISLEADDQNVFNAEMREGEELLFRAKQRFVFKSIGNAGGIQVTLNDVAVSPLGESGDVVKNIVFDHEYLASRAGTAPPAGTSRRIIQEP